MDKDDKRFLDKVEQILLPGFKEPEIDYLLVDVYRQEKATVLVAVPKDWRVYSDKNERELLTELKKNLDEEDWAAASWDKTIVIKSSYKASKPEIDEANVKISLVRQLTAKQ